jgi:hypothetical protein
MRRRRSKIDISLFPFLSVLCAVIGVLVLFIVLVLSTRVVVEDERYQRTEAHRRQPRPGQPQALEQGIDPDTFAALEGEVNRLASLLEERRQERDELTEKVKGLRDLIDTRKTEMLLPRAVKRSIELDRPEPVEVVPDSTYQVSLKPILVEVSVHGYTVHPTREQFLPFRQEPSSSDEPDSIIDPELAKYLRDFDRRKGKEYLLLLVHPNGVKAFDLLRSYLGDKHSEINLGWEPFSRQWILANDAAP